MNYTYNQLTVSSTGLTDLEKDIVYGFHQLNNKTLQPYFTWPSPI